jgi:hypothetical protein
VRAFQLDREAQRGLATGIFSGSRWEAPVRNFLDAHPKSVLFGEQSTMIVQRMAVEQAGPNFGFDVPSQIDEAQLARMVIGAGTLLVSASGPLHTSGPVARKDVWTSPASVDTGSLGGLGR